MHIAPERQSLLRGSLDLSYLQWSQTGEPLLLLHGLADNAWVWGAVAEQLADRYAIVAPDMRGHGDSSKPEDDYTFQSLINDLEALMAHLNWQSAHIVGHSWTGKLVAIWAGQQPQRFRSMVLVDPIFIWQMPGWLRLSFPVLYRLLPFLKTMGPFVSYDAAVTQARTLKEYRAWTPLQQEVFEAGMEQKADGRWGSKFTIAARDRIFEDVLRVPGFTHPVEVPTLFVQPEKGVNRAEWQLAPYRQYLPHLHLRKVPGNHWPFLEQWETFTQVLESFWADVEKPSELG